jgi:peptide/nickel transport system permease protein
VSANVPGYQAATAFPEALRRRTKWSWTAALIRFVTQKRLGAGGGIVLVVLIVTATFAPALAPYDHLEHNIPERMQGPSLDHWVGTDCFGRDQFSRILFGARVSLYVGFVSVVIAASVGLILGVTSAYAGGKFDLIVQRIVDTFMGFPGIVLVLVMVVALQSSLNTVTFAIAVNATPRFIRLARSSAITVKEEVYVLSARALGASAVRIMKNHIIPNSLAPIFVLATGQLGSAIVTEAGLSFLGLGVPPPNPSWGNMLQSAAKEHMEAAPWLAIYPGLALTAVTFAFAVFGDALRDVLDPRLRRGGG